MLLKEIKADERVADILGLKRMINNRIQKKELDKWHKFVQKYLNIKKTVKIGIAGKYMGLLDSYASILKALEHAATSNDVRVKVKFVDTAEIEKGKKTVEEELDKIDGLIIPGGFGVRGVEGKISCVKYFSIVTL